MLSTKAIHTIDEIPREWIFQYYLKLDNFNGKNVLISSVFTNDSNPSMHIYKNERGLYVFKDFSSGKSGDGVDLVYHIFKLSSLREAIFKITYDYSQWVLNKEKVSPGICKCSIVKYKESYKVESYQVRKWNTNDEKFWMSFKINSKLLEEFNVRPLSSYSVVSNQVPDKGFTINREFVYGYFKNNGDLYKIYNPFIKEMKFLKVLDYTQGMEQLRNKETLLFVSSLKDLMCLRKMFDQFDYLAPDSENSLLKPVLINSLKYSYKNLGVLFDNDDAGYRCMKMYNNLYSIPSIVLPLSKDVSDSVKDHGFKKVKNSLIPSINSLFNYEL